MKNIEYELDLALQRFGMKLFERLIEAMNNNNNIDVNKYAQQIIIYEGDNNV